MFQFTTVIQYHIEYYLISKKIYLFCIQWQIHIMKNFEISFNSYKYLNIWALKI